MRRLIVLCFIILLPVSVHAEDRKSQLSNGEIFVNAVPVAGSYYPKVIVEAVVNAPPAAVWDVVRDCPASERVNERVMKSYIVKRIGADVVCSELIDMPWPIRNLESVSRWKFAPGPPVWKKTWSLVRGDFDYANGSWVIKPFDGNPKRSHVVYENHFSPQISVPDWLTKAFLKVGMPGLIKDLRTALKK